MGNAALFVSAGQIITSLGSAALFIWAVYVAVQDFMYIHPEDKPAEDAHSKMSFKKCMLLTAAGIGAYFLSRIFVNIPGMAGQYGLAAIALQALLDTIYRTGVLLLLPIVITFWRKSARKKTYH